jgi:hypothetical protein
MATSRIGLAAILLNEPRLRSANTYAGAIKLMLPGVPVSIMECTARVREFKVGESEVYVPMLPAFPWSDLEPLAKNAWHWKEAEEQLRNHQAHILVTLRLGPEDPLEHAMLLSKVTSAIVAAQECLGIHWQGPAISSPASFRRAVKKAVEGGSYPLLSWINFAVKKDASGTTIVTQGMEELGHKEMEMIALPGDDTAIEYAITLCNQVLKKGPLLRHGDIIGRIAGERFLVSHRPYSMDREKQAIEIDMRKNVSMVKSVIGKLFKK